MYNVNRVNNWSIQMKTLEKYITLDYSIMDWDSREKKWEQFSTLTMV